MTRSTFLVTALLALAACNDRTDRNASASGALPFTSRPSAASTNGD